MSIEAAFYSYLSTTSTVAALVGTRIYEEIMPQKETRAAIVYQIISETRDAYSLQGANGQVETRLQVKCYAETAIARRVLKDTVRMALDGFKGQWNGTEMQSVFFDDSGSAFEEPAGNEAARVWGWRYDLLITHVETVPTFT